MTRRRPAAGAVAALLAVAVLCGGGVAAAKAPPVDPRKQREDVRAERAEAARQLDLLQATDAEIRKALDDLQLNLTEQESEMVQATREADVAARNAADSVAAQVAKQAELDGATASLKALSLAAYEGSPAVTPLDVLSSEDQTQMSLRFGFSQFQAEQLNTEVDRLRKHRDGLEALRIKAEEAKVAALVRQRDEQDQLGRVDKARRDQQNVADALELRIEDTLGESAALAVLDAELSSQIAKQEAELAARIKAQREKAVKEKAERERLLKEKAARDAARASAQTGVGGGNRSSGIASSAAAGAGGGGSGASGSSGSSSGGAGTGTGTGGTRTVAAVKVVTVHGITVAEQIAADIDRLMAAADAAGIGLGGAGFRDPLGQIEIRRTNCGSSDYDIFDKPASECNPPTARPGRSMHEQGLAIDFTCGGKIVNRGDKCFAWLSANAAQFGLKVLPREPWHWSTTGG
jgi:septal ring factor EnvC (AmiA/AmiB activator)